MSGVLFNAEIGKLFLELSPVAGSMALANAAEAVSSNQGVRAIANAVLSLPLAAAGGFLIKDMLSSTKIAQGASAIGCLGAAAIFLLPLFGTAAQHLAEANGSPVLAGCFLQLDKVIATVNKIAFLAISFFTAVIAISTGTVGLSLFYGTLVLVNGGLLMHNLIRS